MILIPPLRRRLTFRPRPPSFRPSRLPQSHRPPIARPPHGFTPRDHPTPLGQCPTPRSALLLARPAPSARTRGLLPRHHHHLHAKPHHRVSCSAPLVHPRLFLFLVTVLCMSLSPICLPVALCPSCVPSSPTPALPPNRPNSVSTGRQRPPPTTRQFFVASIRHRSCPLRPTILHPHTRFRVPPPTCLRRCFRVPPLASIPPTHHCWCSVPSGANS